MRKYEKKDQQALVDVLKQQAMGQGPNPAQAMYKQNVNQAIQQNAGMAASQRGISPALAQRMALQNAAGMSQGAAGNAAVLQAQQQMAAQQQQQGVMQDIGRQQMEAQRINAGGAAQNAAANQQTSSGLMSGFGNALVGGLFGGGKAKGGEVKPIFSFDNSQSQNIAKGMMKEAGIPGYSKGGSMDHFRHIRKLYHGGGQIDVMVSPDEAYIPPSQVNSVASGEKTVQQVGEKIPGKAKVAGDSPKNDTVPRTYEEGGFIIPRTIMESKNAANEAKKFVADHLRENGHGVEGSKEEFKEALKRAIGSRKAA